ncbi:hypothetical protein EZV62_021201 [Acer yangbiense]|uniref:Uncharacterized protein n=1 Tax=Acer yangbiense TaxID=1000413 RepID=A0A5C7H6J3_9ROSI|nr:hypothetical protein EZV62_021201 [Acer yangbiense]
MTMESVLAQSSAHEVQSFSAYKQIKNPNKMISRSFVSKSSENMHIHRGLLLAPPPPPPSHVSRSLSFSYPPSLALHTYNSIQPQQLQQQTSPPLLPLPIPKPRHNSLPSPPPSRKPTRARDQSLTPKKSKQPTRRVEPNITATKQGHYTKPAQKKIAKQQQQQKPQEAVLSESLIVETLNPLGPDPNELPKHVSKVFCAGIVAVNNNTQDLEKFSGSLFTISPPPSSLPLPKFSMRPKQLISCNAEAAGGGVDAGATDSLRRLLRIR